MTNTESNQVAKPGRKKIVWVVLILFAIVSWINLLLVPHYSNRLRPSWIQAGAALGLLITVFAAWWARRNNRLSAALIIALLGNIVGLTTALVPFNSEKSIFYDVAYDAAVLLWVSSFLVRLFSLWKLKKP